ncbi:MAG: hypothetical protein ACI8ZN_001046 [Bacteroidia bacterium]
MSKVKFHLDGNIEAPVESSYKENKTSRLIRIYRRALVLLSSLFVVSIAAVLFLWMQFNSEAVELGALRGVVSEANLFANQQDSLQNQIDSLTLVNIKLIADNEILVENSDRIDGIFFEVQIGSFQDFNIDQYVEHLANLRSEPHEGGNKLLLGRFRSFKKALLFENDLKRIGMKDVFVVGRVDGKLTPVMDALKLAQAEQ